MSYARLEVYFGRCSNAGVREGIFRKNAQSQEEQKRYFGALQFVQEYFERNYDFAINMSPIDPLFNDRKTAEAFCAYAQQSIPDALPSFDLVDCIHGEVRFYRIVHFEGWTKNRRNHLITLLHTSGFIPFFEHKTTLESLQKSGLSSPSLQKELDALDLTTPWKKKLSFHKE